MEGTWNTTREGRWATQRHAKPSHDVKEKRPEACYASTHTQGPHTKVRSPGPWPLVFPDLTPPPPPGIESLPPPSPRSTKKGQTDGGMGHHREKGGRPREDMSTIEHAENKKGLRLALGGPGGGGAPGQGASLILLCLA